MYCFQFDDSTSKCSRWIYNRLHCSNIGESAGQCDKIGQPLAETVLVLVMLLVATLPLCMYGIVFDCWSLKSDLKNHTRC